MKLPLVIAALWGTWAVEAQASQPVVPATTEVVWTTKLQTVVKCPDGVTNCLSSGTAVVTSVVEATTTYCPVVDTPPGYVDGTTMSSDHSSTASSIPSSNVTGASSTAASVPSGTTVSVPAGNATWMSPLPAPSSQANRLPNADELVDPRYYFKEIVDFGRSVATTFGDIVGFIAELYYEMFYELYEEVSEFTWYQWLFLIWVTLFVHLLLYRWAVRTLQKEERMKREEERKKKREKARAKIGGGRVVAMKTRKAPIAKKPTKAEMQRILFRVHHPYYPETEVEYFCRLQARRNWQMDRPEYKEALANDFMTLADIEALMNGMNKKVPVQGPVQEDGTPPQWFSPLGDVPPVQGPREANGTLLFQPPLGLIEA